MPSFLKDLRRRSKASFRTDTTTSSSNGSHESSTNGTVPASVSSSTVDSALGPSTPEKPNNNNKNRSSSNPNLGTTQGNGPPPPQPRLSIVTSQSSRYSANGMSPATGTPKPLSTSPLAPRVLSISDNSWVHQKVLLIYGTVGDPAQQPLDGTLTLARLRLPLQGAGPSPPGPNRLRLDFTSPRIPSSHTALSHSSWVSINFLPLISAPPLQLVLLVAKDSPETFDAVPERVQREGNGIDTAIRKYRMAAYLWQAFTGEQMNRNGFGRRCFRYEEEWQPGTLSYRDMEAGQLRNEAKVHVIRLNKTVAEIRDLDIAQQYEPAKRKGELYSIAMDAVRAHFAPRAGQQQYVSAMFLDTHWDKETQTVRGHAALGGGVEGLKLAIFGSHSLQSYPTHIEEVVGAFSDCTRTDTNIVANDCNESGSSWEAANIGIGAHMHEVGHLFGCPHQENGVMLRDYVRLNRTFCCREPYSTRTKMPGQRLCLPADECNWHRLDTLRFRNHPSFRLPTDPPLSPDDSVQVWSVDNGNVLLTAATGIAFIELFTEGDDLCHTWIEYVNSTNVMRQVTLTDADLRARLPEDRRTRKLKLKIFSGGGGDHTVEDFAQLTTKAARTKLPDGRLGFRSSKLGFSNMDGSSPEEVILESAHIQTKLLLKIKIYHGFCLDGLEFFYEDGTSQLFGKRGGKPGGSTFELDTKRAEVVMGFYLRAGVWIDGIQILTNLGRRSEIYGNATGGSGHTLVPPRGYSIAGVYGSCAQWIDGFGLIISR
ncbi:putative zinc metallo proteinase [Cryomyces antarcticus]